MTSEKRCFRCLQTKPLTSFYKHSRMADGRLNKCIECTKVDVIENRLKKLEYYRQYDRTRSSKPSRAAARKEYSKSFEGQLSHARATKRWCVANAIRKQAQGKLNREIRRGRISPQPCFICGAKAQAHHPDYDRPLDVTWLCPAHHKAAHRIVAEILYNTGQRENLHF